MGLGDDSADDALVPFVVQIGIGKAGRARHIHLAAQSADSFYEERVRPGSGCGNGRRNAGCSAANHDHVIGSLDLHACLPAKLLQCRNYFLRLLILLHPTQKVFKTND